MSRITSILCQVITGRVSGAGTDGNVYLGLGGREFLLDSTADDHERGNERDYIMGGAPFESELEPPLIRVRNKDKNDPREGFPLDTVDLNRAPVYIRFEPEGPNDNWNLSFAAALVYAGSFVVGYTPPTGFDNLWLGRVMGKILYLTDEHRPLRQTGADQRLLDVGRKLAAR
jgi:hypothetical protein